MQITTFVVFSILNSLTIFADDLFFTECGGKLVGPGGTLSSPNYPSSYPNNAKCNWTITAGADEIINLGFKTLDFDGYVNACPDYAVIYDGDSTRSPVIRQLCRYNTSTELANFFVRSTSNKIHVTFTSDAFNQRQGFFANYWTHACPSMTYGPERCTQNCSCVVEHTLYCNNFNGSCTCKNGWTSPTCGTDVDECTHPLIEACPRNYQVCRNTIGGFDCDCQAGLMKDAITGACQADSSRPCTSACPGLCGKVTLPAQVTPTEQCYCPYNTKLVGNQCVACTGLTYGRNCERSCSICDRNNTQRCDNVTGQCICLPGWYGDTCSKDVDECDISRDLRVCRETTENYHCVNTIGSYRCDCYQGYEKTANGTCVTRACSFNLTASEGNISSPDYPKYYSSSNPCSWTISVAQGKSITLRFLKSEFYSFLHIFDGPNADAFLLGRYEGYINSLTIKSTGNAIHLNFNYIYGQFYGLYTTNDYASGCTQIINTTDEKQILKNPGYPTYVNNTVCYWAINAPVGYNVSLRFTDISLDTQGKSFLKVYNPKSANTDFNGPFYGTTIPKAITSKTNTLYVLFQSDGSVVGRGFNAAFLRCLPFFYGEERCTTPCNCVKNNTQYCDSFNGACTCYPGWQSATCADDVDECLRNPCYRTETCVNTIGSYRCIPDCDSNITAVSGSISTIGFPNYAYKNASCKWRIQGSPDQVVTLSIKNQDFQLYEHGTCFYDSLNIFSVNNATSTQIGRYCGTRIPPWIRTSGNIMEIQLKTYPYWVTNGGFSGVFYTHTCKEFTYGPTCQFTCTCDMSKTRFCDNINGVCVCKPGWTGDTCSEDVNECNYNTCPTNEVCKNTPGNYSCECQLGFSRTATGQCEGNSLNCETANNKTCSHFCYRDTSDVVKCTCPENMEIGAVENQCAVTLYPYGADKGDSGLIKTNGNSQYVSKPIVFSTKVPVGAGTETEAYVFNNGVIRFGGNTISSTFELAVKNGFKVIAPYWATLDPTKGEVFYHLYESCEPTVFYESATVTSSPAKAKVMERAAQDVRNTYRFYDFKVKTVLVATWANVQILSSVDETNPPTGTFQSIYITGYRKESIGDQDFSDEETAYVYFLYPKGEMNIIALKNSDTTIGISAGPYANKIQVNQTTFDLVTSKNYNEIITYEIGKISGPEQKCEKHVCKNSQLITNADYRSQISQLYTCPCILDLLGLQWSLYEKRGDLKDIFCYIISPVAKRSILKNNPRNTLCCYMWTQPQMNSDWIKWAESRQQASFIHNTTDAGHVLVGDPWWSLAANESLEAQRSCCKDGNVGKLCDRYNLLYPDNECSYNVTFETAWTLGDPTIVTLDNVTYLFNGRGEYILMDVQSENFTLQARTDRAETSNGTLTNATVFTAFAAKEKEITHFQVELATSKTKIFLYVGGQNITEKFYGSVDYRLSLETIEVFRDDSGNKIKVNVVFPCGVSFAIRIGYKSLELEMQVQKTLQGKTKGLLGNFNGNTKDEFTLPNGTVLRSNLTEREIFYTFANKYQVTQANSVFTYREGKTALDYQFPDFVPFFSDSATASQLQTAKDVCKNGSDSCVFDYLATNDVNFAINTNNTIAQSMAVKKTLANSYPVLSVVSNPNYVNGRWLVQEGVANTLSFKAVDNDADVVTYILVEGSSASLTQNGLLTYTPLVNTPGNVAIRAKDSREGYTPVMSIPITICPTCSGNGQCNMNITRETEYFGGLVRVFKCSCLPGYTGTNCESELDACKDNPCFKGQTCTDLTAAQQGNNEIGYVCGPCPDGYINYNGKCIDADFCARPGRCEHYCNNTDGGYECSCREGFVLNRTDARTCIEQCKTLQCSHICQVVSVDPRVEKCVCPERMRLDTVSGTKCLEINGASSKNGLVSNICIMNVLFILLALLLRQF